MAKNTNGSKMSKQNFINDALLTKVFVLDTNVILHDPNCIYKFDENDVIIPIQVIEELDKFKSGLDTNNYNAREFLRLLDEISKDEGFNGGISLGTGKGTIRVQMAFKFHSKVSTNLNDLNVDASIVNTAFCLKNSVAAYKNREVIIVSKDANLRLKARGLQIPAEDYRSESVTNIASLLASVKELEVSKHFLDILHKNGKENHDFSSYSQISGLINNEPLILKNESNGKHTALVMYRENKVRKIYKDKMKYFGLSPRNMEQAFLMDVLMDPSIDVVTVEGPAGSGKTLIALACGLEMLRQGIYEDIQYARRTIAVENDEIGFLPGNVLDKISPYMGGLQDNLAVLNAIPENVGKISDYKKKNKIAPLDISTIRGRTLSKSFIIIDEVQNLGPVTAKTLVSRAGDGSKVICIGDIHQIDDPYLDEKSNGLSHVIQRLRGQLLHSHITLKEGVRSRLSELAGKLL